MREKKDVNVKVEFTGIKTKPQSKQPLPVMKATAQVQNNVAPNA